MATQVLKFNQAQQAVLNVISCLQSEQDLADLKRTLVKFMNDHLQREMDKLWESGEMSNEKLQKMQSEHLRTAYKLTDK
ncbi:dephospho-CoA kinase [Prevotella sp. AM23-5]|uniref:dephospho-CoA kinase n=1 Tax=Prevotellaceae TaxID=171552 RepID=UPI000E46F835|nr:MULTISPECIES: dephospho-CoA kinase [Prevotellaceae]RHN95254.1 dephospho-CoA kinase [Prevotella sp. AM23-5]